MKQPQKVSRGDLVEYSSYGDRLPLDGDPRDEPELGEDDILTGTVTWNIGDVGLVIEVVKPKRSAKKFWARVLLPTGSGWCLEDELQVIRSSR